MLVHVVSTTGFFYVLRVRTVEHGKVSQEASVELRHAGRCLWVERGDVSDVRDVAPRVFVRVVEAAVVEVLSDHLQRCLVAPRVHLQKNAP